MPYSGTGSGAPTHATAGARPTPRAKVRVGEHPRAYDLVVAMGVSSRWARWVGLAGRRARSSAVQSRGAEPQSPGPCPVVVDIGGRALPEADLGAPLFEVCFAVVDVETTGGSPAT